MKNKRNVLAITAALTVGLGLLAACGHHPAPPSEMVRHYEDGVYRGVFIDGDAIQVNVQIVLEEGVVSSAVFRHLRRDDDYHLFTDEEPYRSVIRQYQEALDHLVGKRVQDHLADLYQPENIVTTQVDGYSAATLRSNKIISAVRDALNRGVYSYA